MVPEDSVFMASGASVAATVDAATVVAAGAAGTEVAAGAPAVGWLVTPTGGNLLSYFLSGQAAEPLHFNIILTGTLISLAGAGTAFLDVKLSAWGTSVLFSFLKPFQTLLEKKYYLDILYGWMIKNLVIGGARLMDWFDRLIVDGAVNGVGRLSLFLGRTLSNIQNGAFQLYLHLTLGMTLFLIFYLSLVKS